VHIAEFPMAEELRAGHPQDSRLDAGVTQLAAWERLFAIRDEVLKALEEARNAKQIGSSLEAKVVLTADKDTTMFLMDYFRELRYIFIVSQVEVHEGDALKVEIQKADGKKCERCWNYSAHVGEYEKYPTVCERCAEALGEIERAIAA
jgi:isoleucyl-tRNA synthetase